MIPRECKRLAEVDFPIAVVSKHSAREKSIRHGHPSTLHLWWARRPLAACRAMLLALLLPDPCDDHCPQDFKEKARKLLRPPVHPKVGPDEKELRVALLKFIGDFSNWDLASDPTYLDVSRSLVKAAHEEMPLVVDPFAGGGSIPLEALRLGCEAFASDLNPVACLILKVMLEDIPRHGPELAEDLRRIGMEIKKKAEKELAEFYPKDLDGAAPIAYLWARTVKCEAPNCGAETPLVRSFWLCKKEDRKRALRYKIFRSGGRSIRIDFEIFEPHGEGDVPPRTVQQGHATCLACGSILSRDRVRAQLAAQRGGADVVFNDKGQRVGGAILLAVVGMKPGEQGRQYRLARNFDYQCIQDACIKIKKILGTVTDQGNSLLPTENLPSPANNKYSVDGLYYNFFPQVRYGLETWGDFFNVRQKLSLAVFANLIREHSETIPSLVLALGKLVDLANTVCPWEPIAECPRNVLSNGRIKPSWSYAEGVPISSSSASFEKCIENLVAGLTATIVNVHPGSVEQTTAQHSPLPDHSADIWFTDPPYYDAIPYAALSDAFWVWIKRALPKPGLLQLKTEGEEGLTPKSLEIIDNLELLRGIRKDKAKAAGIPVKDREFFEVNMASAFKEGCRILMKNGIGCVVFAHQTTEGWEALLSGMIRGGWVIKSSWPIATEMAHRLRARDSAALATSVHLVCRQRQDDSPVGDWADVLSELPKRVSDWMERLESEHIRGADLVFACIGPALEIYSRYSKVVDAEEREIPLGGDPEAREPHRRGFLAYVWEAVGRAALEQILGTAEARARNSAAGSLEEDARLTALFLWALQSTETESGNGNADEPDEEVSDDEESEESPQKPKKGFSLIFDVVRRFAQPLGIHLPEWEGRIIETKKGVVRLFPVIERARQLFGEEGAQAVADRIELEPRLPLTAWLPGLEPTAGAPEIRPRRGGRRAGIRVPDEALQSHRGATTLDRVHAAMILQASGRANALRALLKAEQERGPDFLRLANALSALYPRESEEKRLLDAMLVAIPR
ncbi:MAG: DUF1156 domain-containing protein [Acidobacteriia bacterium]|nr:DUF1156 domain-containing protein [Terriglobia bacterium]